MTVSALVLMSSDLIPLSRGKGPRRRFQVVLPERHVWIPDKTASNVPDSLSSGMHARGVRSYSYHCMSRPLYLIGILIRIETSGNNKHFYKIFYITSKDRYVW